MNKTLLLAVLIFANNAWATPIGARYQYLTAESLPKSLWMYGVSSGQMTGTANQSFDKNGNLVSNAKYFGTDLTFGDISEQIKDEQERALATAAFKVYGKSLNESVGRVENQVNVDISSQTFLIGRGLTDKTDLFFIFPVVSISTQFESKFIASESLNSLVKKLESEGQHSRAREIVQDSKNGLYTQLDENGYKTEYPSDIKTLANIYLNVRHKAYESSSFNILSDSFFIIPSGETFEDNQFLDLRINEEQYSLKQGITISKSFGEKFTSLLSTSYHKRFPFEKKRRIPRSESFRFTTDTDNNTTIQYGDTLGMTLQLNYRLNNTFGMYVGQGLERRYRDKYTGAKFDKKRYELLEDRTDQELGQFYTGVTINTVDHFLKNKFLIPLDLNIQYAQTNLGRNTLNTQTLTFNLIGFYQ